VRHREAAERTLLTGIVAGLAPAALADALLAAETERPFAERGHSLDFVNKAFECLALIGWEHASSVLPTVVARWSRRAARRNQRPGGSRSILLRYVTKQPANCRSY
jgi:hypothetical protein